MPTKNDFGFVHTYLLEDNVGFNFYKKEGAPPYIRFSFAAGSAYDTKPGIAHFLEHMLVSGTEKFPTKDVLAEYIENNGGQIELTTNSDVIRINFQIAQFEDLHIITTLLNEMLHKSLFDEKTIENERGAIFQEYKGKKASSKDYINEVQKRLFFKNSPYGRSSFGTLESIQSIDKKDLIGFKSAFLFNDISVTVAGDINPDDFVKSVMPVLRSNKEKIPAPRIGVATDSFTDFEEYNSDIVDLCVGFPTPQFNLKDKVCFDLIVYHLGVGRSSALLKELRYKQGLVYTVNAGTGVFPNRGFMRVNARCTIDNFQQVIDEIKKVISNVENSLTEKALDFLKIRILKSMIVKLQTAEDWVVSSEILQNLTTSATASDYVNQLNLINHRDVVDVIVKYFKQRLYVGACGPRSAKNIV